MQLADYLPINTITSLGSNFRGKSIIEYNYWLSKLRFKKLSPIFVDYSMSKVLT